MVYVLLSGECVVEDHSESAPDQNRAGESPMGRGRVVLEEPETDVIRVLRQPLEVFAGVGC